MLYFRNQKNTHIFGYCLMFFPNQRICHRIISGLYPLPLFFPFDLIGCHLLQKDPSQNFEFVIIASLQILSRLLY